MSNKRVFIIGGGGMVGATAAYAIAIRNVAQEIILIDVAQDAVEAHASDIDHATAFAHGVQVRVGDYADIQTDDIIVITCGVAQKPGQNRMDLLQTNVRIIRDVIRRIMAQTESVYILMVANPVDVLTYVALKESGLPRERVMGTGTTLDSARLRVRIARDLHVSQNEVQGYILGEHGDSSFAALSQVNVAGVPLKDFPGYLPAMTDGVEDSVRQAAYSIVRAGKASHYGIGQVVATIVQALQRDTASIFPVCSYVDGAYDLHDVTIGLPSLVSADGVRIIDSYPLSQSEKAQLAASAEKLRVAIASVMQGA